jgi:hypothetical protein
MNRARVAFSAALVATTLATGTALAGQAAQAPPLTSVLAGKKFTPPIKGEAVIEFTQPVTKREKDMVVTRITVRNASVGPVPRLTVAETWYDKGGAIVSGGKGSINGLLQPGEIQTITIETPYNAKMNGNNFNFSHANGSVKPAKVAKLEVPKTEAAATAKPPAKK